MNRVLWALALFAGFAALVATTNLGLGQDKKDKAKKAVGPAVEATDKAGKKWTVWQARTGLKKILADKTYALSALPKEMVGSTFLSRESPELGKWLPDGSLRTKTALTVYAMVQTKARGGVTFSEERQAALVKEGWKEVEGKIGTTFPTGEGWEWKAYKVDVDEGDIFLQLKDLSWDKHGAAELFFFKERAPGKDKP